MSVLQLVSFFLKKSLPLKYFAYRFKTDKRTRIITILLSLVIPSFITTGVIYWKNLSNFYEAFKLINQGPFFLALIFTVLTMVVLVFGFMQAITSLIISKDVELLMPLPIKSKYILLSKILNMVIYEYIIVSIFYIPSILLYGINEGVGILFYLIALIVFLLFPIIPLLIATLIGVVLNRIVGFSRRKETFTLVSSILLITGILYFQITTINSVEITDANILANLINDRMYLLEIFTKYNIYINLAVKALVNSNILYLLGLIVLTYVTLEIFLILFNKMYYNTLLNQKGNIRSNKKINSNYINTYQRKYMLILKNDFRIISRTSAYILNILSIPILIPIVFGIMIKTGVYDEVLVLVSEETLKYFNIGYIVLLLFFTAATPTTSTTFSREGASAWVTQTLPIKSSDHILGRTLMAILIMVLFIFSTLIPLGLLFDILSVSHIYLGIAGLISTLPLILLGLLIDLYKPSLKWTNPTVAVKQNLNVMLSMLAGIILIGIYIGLSFILRFSDIILIVIPIISVITSIIIYKLIEKKFNERLMYFD